MRKGKTKAFYLPNDLCEWLEKEAKEEGRTESNFLVYIIRDYIRRHKAAK